MSEIVIKWLPEDIASYHPEWSEEMCELVLEEIGSRLADRVIEYGYEQLSELVERYIMENDISEEEWADAIK
jgi:hypothetical protein